MRLRKKPWISEAIKDFYGSVILTREAEPKGRWQEEFGRQAPLYVELGTGKGNFIAGMAELYPEINFIGLEAQADVLYYAARKVHERRLANVRLMIFDINNILEIFSPGEVARIFINFCDPWPKTRHAKRRLTHARFLAKYRIIVQHNGAIYFKTDNEKLFEFSLNEFAAYGLKLGNITFDLHKSGYKNNVMTEYEQKFSEQGLKIFRCEARFI